MLVTQKMKMHLDRHDMNQRINAVQGDCYTRQVQISLFENGKAWMLPEALEVEVFYKKADGTEGVYDTLPDGTSAWSAEANVLTIQLAPQMMTRQGLVLVQLALRSGQAILHSFGFYLVVSKALEGVSEDYYNWRSAFLPQLTGAEPGQYIQIEQVDEAGRVIKTRGVRAVVSGGSGENGATFTPYVSLQGDLSWTNDKGLKNPETVNIMGPAGETGPQGPKGERGEKGRDLQKQLHGKTVVCFGDSLFGMYRDETSAPARIAEHTGATVYNVGFGGTRMSVHPTAGYAEFSMWALAKAIAEGNWTSQNAAASKGSDYFAEQLEVLKSIDFSAVDMAVIHFGTNDFQGGVALDDEEGSNNYNSICGALRYSLVKLLTAYPKLRIFVSVPVFRYWTADDGTVIYSGTYTNSNGITLPQVCSALAAVAREYGIPVLDGYHAMGINPINAAGFYNDGVHHNELGRERFGVFLGAGLIAQGAAAAQVDNDDDSSGGSSGGGSDSEHPAYTNQIPISTDTDGSVFNGVGYQEGYRLSSSGGLSDAPGMYVTGFIPAEYLSVVRLKNVGHNYNESTATSQRIALYDANRNFLFTANANATSALLKQFDADGNLTQFTVTNYGGNDASTAAYFRINGSYIGADSVITVNEEIDG